MARGFRIITARASMAMMGPVKRDIVARAQVMMKLGVRATKQRVSVPQPESFAILSHMRWIAALLVAYSHVRQAMLVDYTAIAHPDFAAKGIYWMAAYGHAGVIVFFILSGFLVGGKAMDLARAAEIFTEWPKFLADRVARIFIVLWPALLLSLVIFYALIWLVPNAPFVRLPGWGWDIQVPLNRDLSLVHWFVAATLLNEFLMPTIQVNAPLWSLAYEWFYYVLILAAVLLYRRVWSVAACLVILYALVLLAISLIRAPYIAQAGVIWLLGMGSRAVFNRRILHGAWLRPAALAVVFAVLIIGWLHHFPDLVLGISIAFLIAISDCSPGTEIRRLAKGWRPSLTRFMSYISRSCLASWEFYSRREICRGVCHLILPAFSSPAPRWWRRSCSSNVLRC
jgi:peptidoglycan/LPS O-acetylase OafA/YrhL